MTQETQLIEMLRSKGLKLTRQRRLVLEVLQQDQEHLGAEALYQRAKACDPNISLATIYRTLALFKEIGMVEEHRLGEERAYFEPVQDVPHYHFTCIRCGTVIEFDVPQMVEILQALSQQERVQVIDVHLLVEGYCDPCRIELEREGETNHDG